MRIAPRSLLPLAGVALLTARALSASPAPGDLHAEPPAPLKFHLFASPRAQAPALLLENVPIGASPEGDATHRSLQSRMALRGDRLLVAFRDDSLGTAGFSISTDGGRTFSARSAPVPGTIFGAPDVAFGFDDEVLFAATPASGGIPRLARSSDGGDTFAEAYAVWSKLEAQNPRLAVDTGVASPYRGNVYFTAYDYPFDYYGGTVLTRSTDGGKTFGDPAWRSASWVEAGAPVVTPSGRVLIAQTRWDQAAGAYRATLSISIDGGKTFGPDRDVTSLPWTPSSVAMTADSSGVIHLAFDAPPPDSTSDRSDVFYVRSTDGGATFSVPRRLNDDGGTTGQSDPSIVAGPGGLLAVKWYDRRNDPGSDLLSDVYVVISTDGGLSFGGNLRVTDHTWPGTPPDAGCLVADAANVHLVWTDLRRGNQEIFYAHVPAPPPTPAPDFAICPFDPYAVVLAGRTTSLELQTAALDGFSGDVTLSATGPPGGPVLTFDPGRTRAGEPASLRVATSRDTPVGTYLVTVTAEAQGLRRSVDLRINVHDPDRRATLPLDVSSRRGVAQVVSKPAIDRHGVITVAYSDDSESPGNPRIRFRRSFDGGRTFGEPVVAPLALRAFTVDPNGTLYALHQEGGDLFVSRSADGGGTFAAAVPLTDSHAVLTVMSPAIAADGSGRVVVAYVDLSLTRTLNVVQSSDAGATFHPAARLEGPDPSLSVGSLDVAIDSTGTGFVCYAKSSSGGPAVRLATASAGQPFGAARDIVAGKGFHSSLTFGSDGVVYVAYTDGSGTHLMTSIDGGATFYFFADLRTGGYPPLLVTDRGNAVTIVWSTGSWPFGEVYVLRSTDGGLTFGPGSNLSANPGNSWNPVAAADANGNVLVLWNDDSPGRQRVLASWLPPARIPDAAPGASILEPEGNPQIEATSVVAFRGAATSPDLTATFAYEWDFGDGGTGAGERITHVFAVPGVHTVVLTVIDPAGRRATASKTVTVRVPAASASDTDLVLPVVTDSRGVGSTHYTTELTLVSRSSRPVTALLQYTAAFGSGSGYASLTLSPGEERVIPDAIVFLRSNGLPIPADGSPQVGTLRVVFQGAAPGEVFAGGRTSTPGADGTYGLFYPSAETSASSLTVIGLQENDALRSNLALVNTGDSGVTLRVQLLGANGEDLGTLPDQFLDALGWTQFDRPLRGRANAGRALVTRVAGASTFSAYGVLLDNVTSDGSFVPPLPAGPAGADRLIPVVLDARSVSGARYATELTLANLGGAPLELGFVYTSALGSGSGTASTTLAAGQQLVVPDAIAFLRARGLAIPSDGRDVAGSLRVASQAGSAAFAAGARTFTRVPGGAGTFGVYYSGLTQEESAASTAFVYGLQENAAQRSNVAVVNRGDAGDGIDLALSYFDGQGRSLGGPALVRLAPGEWRQFNQPLAVRNATSGYVRIERVSGSSRFVAYGVLNDNASSDGSYVPMTKQIAEGAP